MTRAGMAGLYAITPEWQDTARLIGAAQASIAGGARVLQYRNKQAKPRVRLEHALALSAVCGASGATFIVNDDVDLALEDQKTRGKYSAGSPRSSASWV